MVFDKFNCSKENLSSFTIYIENKRASEWNRMFSKMYGKPKIPSNSENNGKRWYHTDYNVEGVTKMISINLLMNPSDKQSAQ